MIRQSVIMIMMGLLGGIVAHAGGEGIATTPVSKDGLRMMPVPEDSRNYFVLQSFKKITNVIIGDFGGAEKIICLIVDKAIIQSMRLSNTIRKLRRSDIL